MNLPQEFCNVNKAERDQQGRVAHSWVVNCALCIWQEESGHAIMRYSILVVT